jgi:predicted DNA-binding transcriptional regulator AlpA
MALAPLLVDARQAAALCGVSPATWWRWDAAGRIPAAVRIGSGVVRWRRAELESWTAAGCPPRMEWEALRAAAGAQQNGRR